MDIFEQVEEWKLQDVREEALEEGIKKGLEQSVRSLLAKTELSVEMIASTLDIPVSTVEKIQQELKAK